jgi:hypothetical protein
VGPTDDLNVAEFDRTGNLTRLIGKRGSGPGEHRRVSYILVGPGDTLHILDGELRRHTVRFPADVVVRSARLPILADAAAITKKGDLVVVASIQTPQVAGLPLHVVNAEGEVVRSFGADDLKIELGEKRNPIAHFRRIAAAGPSSIWSARVDAYIVERWKTDGTLESRVTRNVPWFPPGLPLATGRQDEVKPHPSIRGVWEDETGLLWVNISVADALWQPIGNAPKTGRERPPLGMMELHRYVDTIVEVLDPVRGRVIASARRPEILQSVTGSNEFFSRREGSDGGEVIDIWRPRLVYPTR